MVFLLRSLRDHFRLLIRRAHGSPAAGLHFGVLTGRRRTARRVPAAFTSALVDEKPAPIWGVPLSYPARRKIVIGVGRARGTVEGTFACVLVDADQKSAPQDERIDLVVKHS